MDFGFLFWVAGVELSEAKETPGFRSYLTPTPATLNKLTIIHEHTQIRNAFHFFLRLHAHTYFVDGPPVEFDVWRVERKTCCQRLLEAACRV